MRLRDHVADLVEGAADEVHELELGDGTHASERRSEGRAYDGGLGDGRVDDALGAEAVDESVGDLEGAAVDTDVFAEAENSWVAVHFFPDSLADGFEVSKLHRVRFQSSRFQSFATDLHGFSRILLLQMNRGCGLLEATSSLLHFRHPILRSDFMTSVFTEDSAFGGFWRRHRGVHGYFSFCFDHFFHFGDQRFVLFWRQPLLVFHQIILEAGDWVALLPEIEHRLWHVAGGVVNGVAFHAHHFGFDQGGAFAAVGAFDGFAGGVVDLAGVGTIDDHAGDAVSDGAFGEVFAAVLHFRRRGVGPEIALDEKHEAEILHGGEVDAFVGDAGGLAAVADAGHDGEVAALQTRA